MVGRMSKRKQIANACGLSAVKQRGRERKGPPEIIQKLVSESGRFRVQISL